MNHKPQLPLIHLDNSFLLVIISKSNYYWVIHSFNYIEWNSARGRKRTFCKKHLVAINSDLRIRYRSLAVLLCVWAFLVHAKTRPHIGQNVSSRFFFFFFAFLLTLCARSNLPRTHIYTTRLTRNSTPLEFHSIYISLHLPAGSGRNVYIN